MFCLLFLFVLLCNFVYAEDVKAPRPTGVSTAFCAGCADDGCCNQVLADLAFMESQLQELIQCACCQYDITQADIDKGNYTITEPGIYCLTEDVTFTGTGNAITINNTQPEVFLNLKGHTITGDGTGVGIFITNTAYGTTVYNGAITQCDIAINLIDATQVFLDNVNISLCESYGIYAGGTGVGGGLFITNCFVRDTTNEAISLNVQGVSRVANTTVALAGTTGIHIDGCFECLLDSVKVINCNEYGYKITALLDIADAISFKNCFAEACQRGGFIADATDGDLGALLYSQCKSLGCDGNGFDLIAPSFSIKSAEYCDCESKGVHGNGFSSNTSGLGTTISLITYSHCVAQLSFSNGIIGANGDGFFVDGSFFVIKGCNAESNQGSGIALSVNSFNNEVRENTASQNGVFGIEDFGSSNSVYSNIASGNAINYSPAVPLQLLPTDITGYWINVDPTSTTVGEYESKINELLNLEQSCCNAMGSSFDMIASEIESISVFDQSCCTYTNSNINALTGLQTSGFNVATSELNVANSQLQSISGFDQSCCTYTNSNISALTGLQTSGFNVATSELNVANSQLQSISGFDQSCCVATMSAFDVVTSSIDVLDACAPIFITSLPYSIPGPGLYVLCSDLIFSGGSAAITIANYGLGQIVLDFNGHSIIGTGADQGIQLFGNGGEVVIQNGSIQSFGSGIEIYGQNVSLKDMNLLAVGTKGIYVEGGENIRLENINVKIFSDTGIEFYSTSSINAKNCQILAGGSGSVGLFCNGVTYGVFDNIEVSLATKFGIQVVDGPLEIRDVTFANCFVADSYIGVWIEQQASARPINGLSFFDTIIASSLNSGITIRGVDSASFYPVLFKNCTIERTRGNGVELLFGASHILDNCNILSNDGTGVFIDGSDRCQIINSTINNNGSDGVSTNSSNLVMHNSVAHSNRGSGVNVLNNPSIINTQITQCLVNNNDYIGVYIQGSDRAFVEGCVASGNKHGILLDPSATNAQVLHNYVANNPGNGIFDNSGSGYIWGNYSYANGSNYAGAIVFVPVLGAGYWDNVY